MCVSGTAPTHSRLPFSILAPYTIGTLNGALPFIRQPWQKKTPSTVAAVATAVLIGYYAHTGDTLPDWPALTLLTIIVIQASYAPITKNTATTIENHYSRGETLNRDLR